MLRGVKVRSDDRMTIGALARKSGIPVRRLRFYEERGLISPFGRTSKGYRLYGPETLQDLGFLKGAKRLGLHLKDVRELLGIRRRRKCPCGRTREFVEQRLAEVEEAVRELSDLRDEMRRTLQSWEREAGVTQSPCPSVAPLPKG